VVACPDISKPIGYVFFLNRQKLESQQLSLLEIEMGGSFDLPLDPRAVVGLDFAPFAVWGRYLGDAQPYPGAGHPAPRKIDSSGKECF